MPVDYTSGTLPTIVTDYLSEEAGSPKEQSGVGGFGATVTLRCKFEDRQTVMDDILTNDLEYPRKTNSGAFARTGTATPDPKAQTSKDGQGINYEYAFVTINYEQQEFNSGGGGSEIISESLTPNAEFITVDPDGLVWGATDGPALKKKEAPGKLILGFDYIQTRYRVSSIATDYLNLLSHCNNNIVTSSLLGLSFGIETVLYNGITPSRTIDSNGTGLWTVPASFGIRPTGWNMFWRAETQAWESIYIEGGAEFKPVPLGAVGGLVV